jgi:hypothetical protein
LLRFPAQPFEFRFQFRKASLGLLAQQAFLLGALAFRFGPLTLLLARVGVRFGALTLLLARWRSASARWRSCSRNRRSASARRRS